MAPFKILVLTLVVSSSIGCATLTKRDTVRIPVVVAQENAWIEANGQRVNAPAVVTLESPQTPHEIVVGAPGHAPVSLTLRPEFRWRTIVAPLLAPIDLISGNAWQVATRQIEVDLSRGAWTNEPDRAAYVAGADFTRARRSRRIGIGIAAGGVVAGMAGLTLMMSGVCYEACDAGSDRRIAAGGIVMGVATVAMVTGAVMWIRNHSRERRIEERYLSHGPWASTATATTTATR